VERLEKMVEDLVKVGDWSDSLSSNVPLVAKRLETTEDDNIRVLS
jgi:hypothetical protein